MFLLFESQMGPNLKKIKSLYLPVEKQESMVDGSSDYRLCVKSYTHCKNQSNLKQRFS